MEVMNEDVEQVRRQVVATRAVFALYLVMQMNKWPLNNAPVLSLQQFSMSVS